MMAAEVGPAVGWGSYHQIYHKINYDNCGETVKKQGEITEWCEFILVKFD